MTLSVIRRPLVERDLEEIAIHISRDNPAASDRFITAAESTFADIAKRGPLGQLHHFANAAIGAVRIWPVNGFRNYLIFYREAPKGFEVIRVLHAARDWVTLLDETA